MADKAVTAAHAPFEVNALTIRVGASVGIAFSDSSHANTQELIQQADAMLYRAKSSSRGQYAGG